MFSKAPIALLLLGLAATGLAAQDEPIFGGFVDVDLVLVDVVVTDKTGDPVLDLERADFRLYHDGRPVEISQFTEAAARAVTSSAKRSEADPCVSRNPLGVRLAVEEEPAIERDVSSVRVSVTVPLAEISYLSRELRLPTES